MGVVLLCPDAQNLVGAFIAGLIFQPLTGEKVHIRSVEVVENLLDATFTIESHICTLCLGEAVVLHRAGLELELTFTIVSD